MKKLILPLAAAAVFMAVSAASAESRLGEIVGIDTVNHMVTLKDGMQMMVPASKMAGLKVGDKIAVEFEKMGKMMIAHEVINLGPR